MKQRIQVSKEVVKHMKDFGQRPSQSETEAEVRTVAAEGAAAEPEKLSPWSVVTRTNVGKVRTNNEDAVIDCGRLMGVADGMGGHQGGEIASGDARDGLIAQLKDLEPDPMALTKAIKAVNRRIFIKSQENDELRGMGTTLSVIWLGRECAYVGHVGDSRVYLLRGGEMKQITEDHSVVMEYYRSGAITREEMKTHPWRNVITRAVGTSGGVDVDLLASPRKPGDVWLICSDGLHDLVSDEDMAAMLRDNDAEKAADLLIQAALDAGGRDNVSLVILTDREGAQ